MIFTLLSLLFVLDTYLSLKSKTEPVIRYEKFCNSSDYCSGRVKTASFKLNTDKTFSYMWKGEELNIYYSAILKDVRYYSLANNSTITFHPTFHSAQYGIFAIIILVSGMLVLFYPLKSFSSRLIIKTIMMFALFVYMIIQIAFRIK